LVRWQENQKTHIADIDQVVAISIYNKNKIEIIKSTVIYVEQQTARFCNAEQMSVFRFARFVVRFAARNLMTNYYYNNLPTHQNYFSEKTYLTTK
jgi:hypothetical protein